MAHSKRILISGYYGFSNTGDEAVLSAIIAGLKPFDVEITVLSASPEETAKTHGVRALPRTSGAARAIRECDLFISGGGSLIQDATSFRSLAYYLSLIALAKFYRRKVMVLGQGIGPLRRGVSRRLARRALNGVDLITVRDAQSADLLKELGVSGPPVHVTADPTFLLQPCTSDESAKLLAEAGIGEGEDVIAIALREWPESPEIERAASEALVAVSAKLPAKLLLVAMHAPDDMILADRVKQAVNVAVVQPREWTANELLGVLGNCRLVVGMRLHALIFSAAVGVPFLGIEYDPKVANFLAATCQSSMTLEEAASSCLLAEKVLRAWDVREILASRLAELVPAMRDAAAENFRLAGELLIAEGGRK